LKITKKESEAAIREIADNTMANIKRPKDNIRQKKKHTEKERLRNINPIKKTGMNSDVPIRNSNSWCTTGTGRVTCC
jgi:hypothetical protein